MVFGPLHAGPCAPRPPFRFPTWSATSAADTSVTIVSFDSTAFVKPLVEEAGSELAAELWDGCDAAVSSRLAYPEVRAVLAATGRAGRLEPVEHCHADAAWAEFWAATLAVELTVAVHAGDLPDAIRCAALTPSTWPACSSSAPTASCSRCGTSACEWEPWPPEFIWCRRPPSPSQQKWISGRCPRVR